MSALDELIEAARCLAYAPPEIQADRASVPWRRLHFAARALDALRPCCRCHACGRLRECEAHPEPLDDVSLCVCPGSLASHVAAFDEVLAVSAEVDATIKREAS